MSKELLVQTVKEIVAKVRGGQFEEAYGGYRGLFASPWFLELRPEDQRQALRLMVHAKAAPSAPTPAVIEAHRAALTALTDLVSRHEDPYDYEMLGICHLLIGNSEAASRMFRAGLAIERARTPGSDLCGTLMRRVSEI